jgi:hypothetical protein
VLAEIVQLAYGPNRLTLSSGKRTSDNPTSSDERR